MTTNAVVFMMGSRAFVLGLMGRSIACILRHQRHFDPDGIGPGSPPEPARTGRP